MKNSGFEISEATYAFYRTGDEPVEIKVDHPDFYCTHVNGIYRSPEPQCSDRDPVSWFDVEDALIDMIDAKREPHDDADEDDFSCDDEHDAAMAEFRAWTEGLTNEERAEVKKALEVDDIDELAPKAISGRRAALADPKVILKETGPDRHAWKDNTKNPAQHMRHNRRIVVTPSSAPLAPCRNMQDFS